MNNKIQKLSKAIGSISIEWDKQDVPLFVRQNMLERLLKAKSLKVIRNVLRLHKIPEFQIENILK